MAREAVPVFCGKGLIFAGSGPAAAGFDLAATAFGFQAAALGTGRGAGTSPRFRPMHRLDQKLAQPVHHRLAIGVLGAIGFGHDVDFACSGQAFARQGLESFDGIFPQALQGGNQDPQFGLGVELVDILATGSAAA